MRNIIIKHPETLGIMNQANISDPSTLYCIDPSTIDLSSICISPNHAKTVSGNAPRQTIIEDFVSRGYDKNIVETILSRTNGDVNKTSNVLYKGG